MRSLIHFFGSIAAQGGNMSRSEDLLSKMSTCGFLERLEKCFRMLWTVLRAFETPFEVGGV